LNLSFHKHYEKDEIRFKKKYTQSHLWHYNLKHTSWNGELEVSFFNCWKSSFIYCQKSHSLHIRFGNLGQISEAGIWVHSRVVQSFVFRVVLHIKLKIWQHEPHQNPTVKRSNMFSWHRKPICPEFPKRMCREWDFWQYIVLLLNDTNITNGVMARVIAASAVDYVLKPRYGSKPKTIKLVFAVSPISVQQ
jgi:hypothetical protein